MLGFPSRVPLSGWYKHLADVRIAHGKRLGFCLDMGVGEHQWYHVGVGAPPIFVYLGSTRLLNMAEFSP